MRVEIGEQCVINANALFWGQMLGMTFETVRISGEFCLQAGHLHASVDLSGMWQGRIEVRMTEHLAYEATSAMMMQPVGSVVEGDVLDASKEIANMIAGVIKSSNHGPAL